MMKNSVLKLRQRQCQKCKAEYFTLKYRERGHKKDYICGACRVEWKEESPPVFLHGQRCTDFGLRPAQQGSRKTWYDTVVFPQKNIF